MPRAPQFAAVAVLAVLAALLACPLLAAAPPTAPAVLAQAQEMIDGGNPKPALPLLDGLLKREPGNARAYLLRSTARFLNDDLDGGKKDLDKAIELDPSQRQAWLHRGAFELSAKHFDAAIAAFTQAEKLDPKAPDNDINMGAVLLLAGKLEAANGRFERYILAHPGVADPQVLVASNYANAGYAALAIEHLRRAIAIDERARLQARTDPNFATLAGDRRFADLLAIDGYKLPTGARFATHEFDLPYDGQDGKLLGAVVEAMNELKERYDPRIERTPDWALIWGDLRVKVARAMGKSRVEVSAPLDRLSTADWNRRTDRLFQAITAQIYSRRLADAKRREPGQ